MGAEPSPGTPDAIGVDLGGTKMLAGVVAAGPTVLHRSEEPSLGLSTEQLLDTLEAQLRSAIDACPGVRAVGLGIPCTIDRERGLAISAVNLPIVDVPIRDLMSERLGLPVHIDNDGNCAALAEHRWGAAQGARNVVLLTIGTGIGGGLIINGEVFRGSTGAGAELGHIVIEADGPRCQGNCPNHGCVEALASGTALGREARAAAERNPDSVLGRRLAAGKVVDGRFATHAAIDGDEVAREVVALIGRRLGVALSGLANVFQPDVILLGGGVMAAGELLMGPARDEMRSRALPPSNRTRVAAAELGPEAGMIGAATMAAETLEGVH
jgi:glucokinase